VRREHPEGKGFKAESRILLVFYLEDAETFRAAVARLESLGHMPVGFEEKRHAEN
jgi:hypothetical protein